MFEVINKNLTDAGFVTQPTSLPWNPDYLDAVSAGGADLHLLGWTGDYNDAYNFIGTFFADAGGGQAKEEFGGFVSPEIFEALATADAEPDAAARTELYQEANRVIMDFLPAVPISHSPNALVVAENVDGSGAQPAVRRGLLDRHHQRLTQSSDRAGGGTCRRRRGRPVRERLT